MKRIMGFLLIMVMLVGLGTGALAADEENWREVTNITGTGRYGAAIVSVGDEIFIISGRENATNSVGNSVDIYNVKTNSWRSGAPIPNPTYAPAFSVVENNIYIFDGYNINRMQIYDTASDAWSDGGALDFSIFAASAVTIDQKIYIMGGVTNGYTGINNGLHIYDTETKTWTVGEAMPVGVAHTTAAPVDGKIYLFGGMAALSGATTDMVQVYDTRSGHWNTDAALLSEARGAGMSVAVGNKIYVMGGVPVASNSAASTDEVKVYDVTTNTWSDAPSLSLGRQSGGAVEINGHIYIVTGFNTPSIHALSVSDPTTEVLALSVLLDVGEQLQLSVTYDLIDNTDCTWSSSNPVAATVDSAGKVTAVAEGLTYITAKKDDENFEETVPVRVIKNAAEKRLSVHVSSGSKQMLYLVEDPSAVVWSTMDPTVATVSPAGEISAVKRGLTIVQAEYDGKTYQIYVRVY